MKKTLCFITLTLLLSLAFCGLSAAETEYINGIDANFPPFAYVDKSGQPSGFDVDSVDWIAEKMGFTVKHQPVDWDGIIPNLITKKIDFIASGMSITPERAEKVDFTIPYWTIKQVFVAKKDADVSVEDILKGGKTLGVQQGTSEADWLKESAGEKGWNFKLRYYNSAPLAVEDVLNGRIDAAAMDDAPAEDAVQKKPIKILGTFGMKEERFGYAVRKEDTDLLITLNKGLEMLMADPYWGELIAKYKLKEK